MQTLHSDETRVGASFLAKRSQVNPRELLVRIIEGAGDVTDKDALFARFREALQEDEQFQRAVDWYFFVNMYDYMVTSRNHKPTAAARAALTQQVEQIKRQVERVVLLNLVLPSGKALRDATFAECARAGGWFAKIAKMGKPRQVVGKVVTEGQLQAVAL